MAFSIVSKGRPSEVIHFVKPRIHSECWCVADLVRSLCSRRLMWECRLLVRSFTVIYTTYIGQKKHWNALLHLQDLYWYTCIILPFLSTVASGKISWYASERWEPWERAERISVVQSKNEKPFSSKHRSWWLAAQMSAGWEGLSIGVSRNQFDRSTWRSTSSTWSLSPEISKDSWESFAGTNIFICITSALSW